ncbi:MAG: 4a-hydroxytetrahydrobiopterin dehydratase [Bacteroidota bacterium]
MNWKEEDNKLKKTFQFNDFVEAFGFISRVAIIAEKLNHHPTWTNTYHTVSFELSTHDAGDIVTEKDHMLAAEIDKLVFVKSS